jgi:hypothetical protein
MKGNIEKKSQIRDSSYILNIFLRAEVATHQHVINHKIKTELHFIEDALDKVHQQLQRNVEYLHEIKNHLAGFRYQ